MITKFNLFENNILFGNEIFEIKGNMLKISDRILHYFLFTKQKNITNKWKKKLCNKKIKDETYFDVYTFFNGDRKYNTRQFNTCYTLTYNHNYAMNIIIKKLKYGENIKYYIAGNSGDFYMHQKGRVRATKEINLKIIQMFFPNIKNDVEYRKFLNNEIKFSELVSDYSTYKKLTNKTEKIYQNYLMKRKQIDFNI